MFKRGAVAITLVTALALSSCTGGGGPSGRPSPSPTPTPVPTGISIHLFRAKVGQLCTNLEARFPRFRETQKRKVYLRKLTNATKVFRTFVTRLRRVPEPEGYEGTYAEYVKISDQFLVQMKRLKRVIKDREKVLKLVIAIVRNELRHVEVAGAAGLPDICSGVKRAEVYEDLFAAKANLMCERHFDDVEDIADQLEAASSNSAIRDLYGRLYTVEQRAIKQIPKAIPDELGRRRQIKKVLALYRDTSATVARMRDAFAVLSQSAYDAAFADFRSTRRKALKLGDRLDLYVCNALF